MRLKNNVTGAIIQNNKIEGCGIWDYNFDKGGGNGEGIYIGTSKKQVLKIPYVSSVIYPLRCTFYPSIIHRLNRGNNFFIVMRFKTSEPHTLRLLPMLLAVGDR